VIAKPQLRGAEGVPLELNLGEDIPVPSTTFTPVAAGGANSQPLTSFNYRSVGVNVKMTSKVTYEGDIRMELFVESSTLGAGVVIAGQELPSFGSRKVTTVLRLREGESSLLAGLLREDQAEAALRLSIPAACADHQAALFEQRHQRDAERHRDVADAANRADPRAHATGCRTDSHRHAGQSRIERSATAPRTAGSRARWFGDACSNAAAGTCPGTSCAAGVRTADSSRSGTATGSVTAAAGAISARAGAGPSGGASDRGPHRAGGAGRAGSNDGRWRRADSRVGATGIQSGRWAIYGAHFDHRSITDLKRLIDGHL
jgi:hypothetical protein